MGMQIKVVPRKRSCVLWDGALVFYCIVKRGERMNLNEQMLPGLFLLLAGAVLGFGAEKLCRKKQNVPQMKMLGLFLCVVGAVLVFIG